jgi:DNA polymerase
LRSLTGKTLPITANRGKILESLEGVPVFPTVHPSFLLRIPEADRAEAERKVFVDDLRQAFQMLQTMPKVAPQPSLF